MIDELSKRQGLNFGKKEVDKTQRHVMIDELSKKTEFELPEKGSGQNLKDML